MKDKYIPGQDCGCHAYSESECGCDADWTPTEVYELREQLKSERALADRLAGVLEFYSINLFITHHTGIADALTAWKEARK